MTTERESKVPPTPKHTPYCLEYDRCCDGMCLQCCCCGVPQIPHKEPSRHEVNHDD